MVFLSYWLHAVVMNVYDLYIFQSPLFSYKTHSIPAGKLFFLTFAQILNLEL